MNFKKIKIAVVIVTYNREKLLLECLNALSRQTRLPDCIYVFDNASTDGTHDLFVEKFSVDGFSRPGLEQPEQDDLESYPCRFPAGLNNESVFGYYLRSRVNIGGAGGFHEAIKLANQAGFNWVFVMDDDAEPVPNTFQILESFLEQHSADEKISALACKKVDHMGNIEKIHRGYFCPFRLKTIPLSRKKYSNDKVEIDYASFVGLFINIEAVKLAGYPLKNFFIYFDDVEYCLRLQKFGAIYLVPASVIVHKDKINLQSGANIKNIPVNEFWKRYFGIRNLTYFVQLNFNVRTMKSFLFIFFPRAIKMVVTQSNIKIKLCLLWKGWKDGLHGNMSADVNDVKIIINNVADRRKT